MPGVLAQTGASGSHAPVTTPRHPQENEGQSLPDPCPHLAGRAIALLKTPLPRLVSHQPSHEAQGAG